MQVGVCIRTEYEEEAGRKCRKWRWAAGLVEGPAATQERAQTKLGCSRVQKDLWKNGRASGWTTNGRTGRAVKCSRDSHALASQKGARRGAKWPGTLAEAKRECSLGPQLSSSDIRTRKTKIKRTKKLKTPNGHKVTGRHLDPLPSLLCRLVGLTEKGRKEKEPANGVPRCCFCP